MTEITLFKYRGEPNRINKTLSDGVTLQGYLYDGTNIVTPTVKLQGIENATYNYAYIKELNRYYFITGATVTDSNFVDVKMQIDALFTYREQILSANATIKSDETANKFLNTTQNVYDMRRESKKIDFPNTPFDKDKIIMVTIRGIYV